MQKKILIEYTGTTLLKEGLVEIAKQNWKIRALNEAKTMENLIKNEKSNEILAPDYE
jgi:hypothetical protein